LKAKAKSQQFLKKYVLEESLCTGCGACVGICPYQVIYHDRTVQLHSCDLEDGRCYNYCPRTLSDLTAIRKMLFEADALTPEIGAVKGYYFSRTSDPELHTLAQHGGTVTALMALAISEGLIDSAIVSARNQDFEQEGVMISDKMNLRENAGSKFTVSPTVAAFNQLITQETGNVGVVATPCQALALAKMRLNPGEKDRARMNQLQLVVGLYCGWTLSEEKYLKLLTDKGIVSEAITKMDIPAGRNVLEIHAKDGVHSIAMEEVQNCIREACLYCMDSTAECADLSVGSARFAGGWEEVRKWNQLIVRTKRGKELVELAVKKGILEIREAPVESLKELKDAAVKKKKDALKNIIRKSSSVKNLLYLDSRDPAVLRYLEIEKENRKEKMLSKSSYRRRLVSRT
jgi:coenzyme F420 hydrogenase subunit beta